MLEGTAKPRRRDNCAERRQAIGRVGLPHSGKRIGRDDVPFEGGEQAAALGFGEREVEGSLNARWAERPL